MASLVTQDILNRVNDLLGNYTTGSIDTGARMRAVNSAIEYVKRRMTLPSDELVQKFYFYEDTQFYPVNVDFNEGLQLIYDDLTLNTPDNEWSYLPYGDILRKSGLQNSTTQNFFSWTPIRNNKMQLLMFGNNLNQGQTLATFDAISGFVGQNDAQNVGIDSNIFYEGSGSLKFDINPNLGGTGMASIYWPVTADIFQLINKVGIMKLAVWLASTNLSSINLIAGTDLTNYYAFDATTFDDGSAFSTGLDAWKKVKFDSATVTLVGSPNPHNITFYRVDFVLNGSFGSVTVPNFRIDDLYSVYPDYMDLIYLTSYKGTAKDGVTNKIFLDAVDDIPAFANFVPDILDAVSLRAAVYLVPSLMSNSEFRKMYQNDHEDVMRVYGKSWPRKRIITHGKAILSRPKR